MTRLKEQYEKVVRPALMSEFNYTNPMQVPRLEKIIINMGVGKATQDSKKLTVAVNELAAIAGQKPVVTKARKSIATFKLREGMNIGAKVTLRRERMYEFLDRLITIAMPRVRDFRGIAGKGFDGRCCNFLRVQYDELKARVLKGDLSDELLLAWADERGIDWPSTSIFRSSPRAAS